jgi:hypothetical protein
MNDQEKPGSGGPTPKPGVAYAKWGDRITVASKLHTQAQLEQSIADMRHTFTVEQSNQCRALHPDTRVALTAAEGELVANILEMRDKPTIVGVIRKPDSYPLNAVMSGVATFFSELCKR